jgi:rhodanese-related sulfurtransferase
VPRQATTRAHSTVEGLLAEARARVPRLGPREAELALREGARLVDIRSELQRARDGVVPGACFVPRNVLEWRLDPSCPHRDRTLAQAGARIILMCDEGCQSSLAAAALQRYGLAEVSDLIGGFQAWQAAGLPAQTEEEPAMRAIGSRRRVTPEGP